MKRRALIIGLTLVFLLAGRQLFSVIASANGWHFRMTASSDQIVSQGFGYTMAIDNAGSLWGWGAGVLGDGSNQVLFGDNPTLTPVKIMDSVASVVALRQRTFAITTDGNLYAWGSGALGDGVEYDWGRPALTPVRIMDSVVSVTANDSSTTVGIYSTFAITTDGGLWAWGTGQLGDGIVREMFSENPALTPVKIMDSVVSVNTDHDRAYAIQTDGSLWAWGSTDSGLLGCGTIGDWSSFRTTPIKIMDSIESVHIGFDSTMALGTDGSLWAWGVGPLGDGRMYSWERPLTTPTKILDDVVCISGSKALRADGSLWAWGYSALGEGTVRGWERPALTPVKFMDSVATILETGYSYSMVITTDGSLWAWGSNLGGQLGDGTASGYDYGSGVVVYFEDYGYDDDEHTYIDNDRHAPVMILDSVVYASSFGHYFPGSTIAIRADGSIWAWGSNNQGQLGDGTTEQRYSPVRILEGVGWAGFAIDADIAYDSEPDTIIETTPEQPTQQETPTEPPAESEPERVPDTIATPESRSPVPFWLIILCVILFIISGVSLTIHFIINRKPGR